MKMLRGRAAKAKAGALGAGGGGFVALLAISEVIPDAPWWARAVLFVIVAGVVGYFTVYQAPANDPS